MLISISASDGATLFNNAMQYVTFFTYQHLNIIRQTALTYNPFSQVEEEVIGPEHGVVVDSQPNRVDQDVQVRVWHCNTGGHS